jgi:hypothetical protein
LLEIILLASSPLGEKNISRTASTQNKAENKIIWHSGIDGESSSRLDKKLIMYSAGVLQKGSLKVCRKEAESRSPGRLS